MKKMLPKLSPAWQVENLAIREPLLSLNVNPFHAEPSDDLVVLHVFRPKWLEPQRPPHLIRTDANRGPRPREQPAAKPGSADGREAQ